MSTPTLAELSARNYKNGADRRLFVEFLVLTSICLKKVSYLTCETVYVGHEELYKIWTHVFFFFFLTMVRNIEDIYDIYGADRVISNPKNEGAITTSIRQTIVSEWIKTFTNNQRKDFKSMCGMIRRTVSNIDLDCFNHFEQEYFDGVPWRQNCPFEDRTVLFHYSRWLSE